MPTEEMTGTKKAILVTFSADSSDTDKGFKLEYWSVPKGKASYL